MALNGSESHQRCNKNNCVSATPISNEHAQKYPIGTFTKLDISSVKKIWVFFNKIILQVKWSMERSAKMCDVLDIIQI